MMLSTGALTGKRWKVAFELAAATRVDFRLVATGHGVGIVRVLSKEA